jgi:hypothetical protein
MTSVSKVESSGSGVTAADQAPPSRRIYVAASLIPSVAGNQINRWCSRMEFLRPPPGNGPSQPAEYGSALPIVLFANVPEFWVAPHTSLKLPGRAARSRGRTCTGEFQSIHGMLPDSFWRVTA